MWRLATVRAQATSSDVIIAQDVQIASGAVVKKFFNGDLHSLYNLATRIQQQDPTLPVWNREFCWYEVIDERKPARVFIDIETTNGNYETVKAGIQTMITLLNDVLEYNGLWHVADASNAQKISFHVVGGPAFKNLYHVGAIIRKFSLYAHNDRNTCADLFDNDGAFIIDEAIYTKGRQFRLFGAHKLGSTRVLRSNIMWFDALVNVKTNTPRIVTEIDGSEPVSTSASAINLFEQKDDGSWTRKGSISTVQGKLIHSIPASLQLVLRSLHSHDPHIQLCDTVYNTAYKTWRVPSRSTVCGIAQRAHKSNHVWYTIDIVSKTVHQRCMDESCRGQAVPIPVDGWCDILYEPIFKHGCVSETCSDFIHVALGLRHAQEMHCPNAYVICINKTSKAWRPTLRLWKELPDICFPVEIAVWFKKDNRLRVIGTLHAAKDELRVQDICNNAQPSTFPHVWNEITEGRTDTWAFNRMQEDLFRCITV